MDLYRASAFYKRFVDEPDKKSKDQRTFSERDYDRILYSSAYRRLAAVSQVVSAGESHVFHNRLTHSMQVAQLARRLAQKLQREVPKQVGEIGGIDVDAAEAAGLAHDLGHPPFGHIAEDELNIQLTTKYKQKEGYEGNAQSFRIVTTLAMRAASPLDGLNLSRVTLNAILKYPWLHSRDDNEKAHYKWGAYGSEERQLRFARELEPAGSKRKSIEAEIMDWADDVTYAVHDAEDFYRAGLIPLDRLALLEDDSERKRFYEGIKSRPELLKVIGVKAGEELPAEHVAAFEEVITGFPIDEVYKATPEQRARLRDFVSALIGEYANAFELHVPANSKEPYARIDEKRKRQVQMLKFLTWHYVIYNPALATQQYGQRRIIRDLLEILHEAGTDPKQKSINIFPFAYRDALFAAAQDYEEVSRVVADVISSMTERQAVQMHQRLTGTSLGSALDDLSR